MLVKKFNPNVRLPSKGTPHAAAFDIYMPAHGQVSSDNQVFTLGFAVAIPEGFVGILVPRSSMGSKHGLCLTNTIGVIDSDYRGEVMACMHVKEGYVPIEFNAGDRLLQLMVVPHYIREVEEVDSLPETKRGDGGFGSTGKS